MRNLYSLFIWGPARENIKQSCDTVPLTMNTSSQNGNHRVPHIAFKGKSNINLHGSVRNTATATRLFCVLYISTVQAKFLNNWVDMHKIFDFFASKTSAKIKI